MAHATYLPLFLGPFAGGPAFEKEGRGRECELEIGS